MKTVSQTLVTPLLAVPAMSALMWFSDTLLSQLYPGALLPQVVCTGLLFALTTVLLILAQRNLPDEHCGPTVVAMRRSVHTRVAVMVGLAVSILALRLLMTWMGLSQSDLLLRLRIDAALLVPYLFLFWMSRPQR